MMTNIDKNYKLECIEKADELGNLMKESEASIRLADAKAAFENDADAKRAYDEYNEFQEHFKIAAASGFMTQSGYEETLGKLVEMEIDLKNRLVVREYLQADSDYSKFANAIISKLKKSFGISDGGSSGCGGCGCGGKK